MDLKVYLESKDISRTKFAKMIGVHPSTITNYISWRRKPTLEIGKCIEVATNGKVTIEDLLAYWESNAKYG